ncbi:hypothetical protein [Endozoicomonas ascidiicola]|uniref:hypothetical protein n=1 Tax=Endozoicomonas ascidiicola TaxID=1698521 RepID=UPI0012F7B413|nr:hypothetical protein [Endozoicomonas ascidiicola]
MDTQLRVKRSTNPIYLDEHLQMGLIKQGVGARQEQTIPPQQGGGYLNICSSSEVSGSALSELASMGVSKTWLDVAAVIGVPAFLEMWQVLDQAIDQGAELNSSIRVTVPRYERYLRYQRDQVIKALANEGESPVVIHKYLRAEMGIDISLRTVQRVARRCHEPAAEEKIRHIPASQYRQAGRERASPGIST